MLVDELRKNYDLYTRELSKEEVLEMYGEVIEVYIDRLRARKTVRSYKFSNFVIYDDQMKFNGSGKWIPLLHFKSIVKYFESEGLEVKYTKNSIEFSW